MTDSVTEAMKLEPCPFCAAQPTEDFDKWAMVRNIAHFIRCPKCHSRTGNWGAREAAIAAWNRRTDNETWLAIPGWEGAYEASSKGLIRSLDRKITHSDGGIRFHRGRVLSPKVSNKGYLMVGLFDAEKGKRAFTTVHRLVASTFIANPQGLPEVNHIDGHKENCAASNLEWCSESQNSRHSVEKRLSPVAKLSDDQVSDILSALAAGVPKKELARRYGADPKTIRLIATGDTYTWVDRRSPSPISPTPQEETAPLEGEAFAIAENETYDIGKRDGYEEAVQKIDTLTGGDGEYRYCTDHDPDRHTPDAPAMIQRIVDRFASRSPSPISPTPQAVEALREALRMTKASLDLLQRAMDCGDPESEIKVRVADLRADVARSLTE